MAIPRVGEKVVRAQAAILAGALLYDRGSDHGGLGQRDVGRTIECQEVPEVVGAPMRYVHKGRTGDNAVIVAGELQGLVRGLSAAVRAPEEVRESRTFSNNDRGGSAGGLGRVPWHFPRPVRINGSAKGPDSAR